MVLEAESNRGSIGSFLLLWSAISVLSVQQCDWYMLSDRKSQDIRIIPKSLHFIAVFSFCCGVTICSFRRFFDTHLSCVCAKWDRGPERGSEMGSEQGARAAVPSMHSPFCLTSVPAASKPLLPVCLKENQLVLFQFAFVSHSLFITFVCHFCHFYRASKSSCQDLKQHDIPFCEFVIHSWECHCHSFYYLHSQVHRVTVWHPSFQCQHLHW